MSIPIVDQMIDGRLTEFTSFSTRNTLSSRNDMRLNWSTDIMLETMGSISDNRRVNCCVREVALRRRPKPACGSLNVSETKLERFKLFSYPNIPHPNNLGLVLKGSDN